MSDSLFYRTFALDRAKIDPAKREIELSFSSETPVQRFGQFEILDHSPGSVDLTRLNSGAAVLLNHDPDKQIGGVIPESARIDQDKVGRARVRFSKSALAQEIFTDIADGIRNAVSVGYTRGKVLAKELRDGVEYVTWSFVPHEISIVAVAADATVGVGRAAHFETTEQNQGRGIMSDAATETKPDKNVKGILALARTFNVPLADAERFINEGKSKEEFQGFILESRHKAQPVGQLMPDGEIGLSGRELESYSLVRAIRGFTENKRFEGLEWEASVASEKRYKRTAPTNGLIVPFDVLLHKRALNATTPSAGGYTIGTDVLAANFIDLLRNKTLVTTLGARMLNGLTGDVTIPKLASDPTATWLAETAAISDSQPSFGQVLMTPHRLGSSVPLSKQLIVQSSLDVETLVRRLLATVLAQGFDLAAIAGTGAAGQPLGIINTADIGTVTYGAAATWAKVVESETTLATANADTGRLAWLVSPETRGKWRTIPRESGEADYIWGDDNRVAGYAAAVTAQLSSSDRTIFGNWEDLILGSWGDGLDLVVDPFTLAKSNQVQITVNMHGDVALARPASFVVSTDSGAQ